MKGLEEKMDESNYDILPEQEIKQFSGRQKIKRQFLNGKLFLM